MATLTMPLPDDPTAPRTYRLATDCPRCGSPLELRQNRRTDVLFTGCSTYPQCTFTEPHDPRVQTLSTAVVQVLQALAQQVAAAQAPAQQQVAAARAALGRTVRQLMALAHPDRWPDTPLAHELTVALVALRETLRAGEPVGR
jgi:hypothetical protein